MFVFCINAPSSPEISTLSLHDALPISSNVNFVDSRLAALYGLPDPGSATLTRVQNTSGQRVGFLGLAGFLTDRKSTRLNSSHPSISYAVFCLKKKTSSIASF